MWALITVVLYPYLYEVVGMCLHLEPDSENRRELSKAFGCRNNLFIDN